MPRCPSRADQVCGHDGLAVAPLKRVQAPSPNAINADVIRNQRPSLRLVISSVNALRGVDC